MLNLIARILKVLNSETNPGQISLALCFAMLAGFTPICTLHNILVLVLVLILRVNLSAFILALPFFSGIAYILDPLFHKIGFTVLTAGPLLDLWTALYNSTLWRMERFYNTIVMGSLLFSLIIFVPAYMASNRIILRYREHILEYVRKSRIAQIIKGSKIYRIYSSLSGMGDES